MRINQKLMKALKFIGAAAAFAVIVPFVGAKASADTVVAFEVTGGTPDNDYTYESGVLTIMSEKAITIANKDPNTSTTDRIEVADGISANITLAGVNIDVSTQAYTAAFKIANGSTGSVTITLADDSENFLRSGQYCAGLQKSGDSGTLTIQGTGSLEAKGGAGGAGIGGGYVGNGSNITINGGTVTATCGYHGAGIGGGYGGSGEKIEISGGTVTATGGYYGAGIGGGNGGNGSNITISDGKVTAKGGDSGAGIGGGYVGNGSNITINGGTVTAIGGDYGAGIGGNGTGSNITINGGTVTAKGGYNGAGIGGYSGSGSNITITGGSVKATKGANANAIGSGYGGNEPVTPTLKDKKTFVYLCTIENPDSANVTIDGKGYTPKNHTAAEPADTNLYAYLTGKEHSVIVGNTKYNCTFNNTEYTFKLDVITNPSPKPNPNPNPTPSGGPTRPTKPETPDYPEINGKAMSWENIAKDIAKLDEGSEITLVIYDHTEVPADVINAISDRKIKAALKVGGRKEWLVDGAKITEKVLKNVDFALGSADVSGKEKLRGIVGFEFNFDGAEFTSELSLMFKEEHAGKFANLFRKDGEKLVFIDNAKIGSDGSVSGLAVLEKGEYAVMICEFSDRTGDVDNDGILTAKDALAALKHFAKLEIGANSAVGDMNNDGVINANDALIILKKYAGIAG